MARLLDRYKQEIVPELVSALGVKSLLAVPRLRKVVRPPIALRLSPSAPRWGTANHSSKALERSTVPAMFCQRLGDRQNKESVLSYPVLASEQQGTPISVL